MVENKSMSHIAFYDDVEIKVFNIDKGQGLPLHEHRIGHMTICGAGRVVCRSAGTEVVLTKESAPYYFVPQIPHEIEALEDGSVVINLAAKEFCHPSMASYSSSLNALL
jgi:quercetin dioxygenase-like cupin family protein